jgi:uncharacterized protein YndB with AHSA1/START domain
MGNVENVEPYLAPLRKSVTVRRTPGEAFEIFIARFASWWPYTRFSIHQDETATCGIEPRLGGDVYEVAKNGTRCVWGSVLAWEPPRRFVMSWHPGRPPETAQEVELRFAAVAGGTLVTLEHRGWAKYGPEAAEAREGYDNGWAVVFEKAFVAACA